MGRRGKRGNGRQLFGVGGDTEEVEERPEDAIIVVDSDGNPVDDAYGDDGDIPITFGPNGEIEAVDRQPVDQDREDPLAALEQQKQLLQRERDEAQRRAQQAEQRVHAVETDNHETTKALFTAALESAKGGLTGAKARYVDCSERGDWKGAADAQEEIARFSQEVGTIEAGARELGDRPAPRQQPTPQTQQPAVDFNTRTDAWINAHLMPNEKAFVQKYRGKIFDPNSDKTFRRMVAIGNVAALEHERDTPEYIAYIEREMKFTQDAPVTQQQQQSKPPQQRKPQHMAPGRAGGARQTVSVELTKAELDTAKRLGMSPARYALNKKTAQDGAKDPDYRGPRFSRDDPAITGNR